MKCESHELLMANMMCGRIIQFNLIDFVRCDDEMKVILEEKNYANIICMQVGARTSARARLFSSISTCGIVASERMSNVLEIECFNCWRPIYAILHLNESHSISLNYLITHLIMPLPVKGHPK